MTRAPEPCQRPRSTARETALLVLLGMGPTTLDAAAAALPDGVGAARSILDGLRDDGRAVLGCDGLYRRTAP